MAFLCAVVVAAVVLDLVLALRADARAYRRMSAAAPSWVAAAWARRIA